MIKRWLMMGMALLAGSGAARADALFDFESDAELWQVTSGHRTTVERSPYFATSGQASLLLTTAAFQDNMPRWPAWAPVSLSITDWSQYEKIAFDLVNPTPYTERVGIIITDPAGGNFGGYFNSCALFLAPYSHQRVVIHLPSIPATIDRTKIGIHLFTEAPEHDYQLHVDNMQLLGYGEEPTAPSAYFCNQVIQLRLRLLAGVDDELAAAERQLRSGNYTPEVRQIGEAAFAALADGVRAAKQRAADGTLALEERQQAVADALGVAKQFARLNELLQWLTQATLPDSGVLAGFVLPERRVFPRDLAIGAIPVATGTMSAARNEREGLTVVAAPLFGDLQQLRATVSEFRLAADPAVTLPATAVTLAPIGFVPIKNAGVLDTPYLGYWPDPILTYLESVAVRRFDYQSWFLNIAVPETQAAGIYRGTVTLTADGMAPIELPVTLTVYDFAIPKHTPLPLAVATTYPRNTGPGVDWTRILTADRPEDKAGREAFDDFLMRYGLTLDHLYRNAPPVYDELERQRDAGKLVQFQVWTFYGPYAPDDEAAYLDGLVAAIRPVYEELKRRDLLEYGYIYGYDEIAGAEAQLGAIARRLHAEFPELAVMSCAMDYTYGNRSAAGEIDIWVPATNVYSHAEALQARARGRQVWYYVCMAPGLPNANLMLDNDLTGVRQLLGLQPALLRLDGFLYFETTMWHDNPNLSGGPFLDGWKTSTSTELHHADGSLFYPGPDGLPIPSLRLEAFRNGLDDFAYYAILQAQSVALRRAESTPASAAWLAEATQVLKIPPELTAGLTEFSTDPVRVRAYRDAMARLIEAAGRPVDPWGEQFNVRSGNVLNHPELQ